MKNLLGILYGAIFGIANIIPGVSGGTMLVTFGCYDQVCGALALDIKEIKKNFKFLIFFAVGAAFGIVGFSNVITLLFDNFPTQTYMFFIGLVLGSIPLILRNATVKEKFNPICAVPFIIALALVIGLSVAEKFSDDPAPVTVTETDTSDVYEVTFTNNSNQVISEWWIEPEWDYDNTNGGPLAWHTASKNVELVRKQSFFDKLFGKPGDEIIVPRTSDEVGESGLEPGEAFTFSFYATEPFILTPKYSYTVTPLFIATIVLASFAAAVAMIIPGVSGSFIMVLLGTYATVVGAVKDFNFVILIPAAIGILLGLVLGAKLIRALLKKHRLMVFSAILGLCAGSLYAILPKGFGLNVDTAIGVLTFAAGGALSFFIGKNTKVEDE